MDQTIAGQSTSQVSGNAISGTAAVLQDPVRGLEQGVGTPAVGQTNSGSTTGINEVKPELAEELEVPLEKKNRYMYWTGVAIVVVVLVVTIIILMGRLRLTEVG